VKPILSIYSIYDESKTSFYPPITNKLQNIFRRHKIKLVHENRRKIKELLGNPKDKTDHLDKAGIYEIQCQGCEASYIGQTKRTIRIRFKEHHDHIRLNHPESSNVAKHVLERMNRTGAPPTT
jgi:predicted GIY-YIG superfamily endonuclease